jgi:signal peptide peptidase SppA
MRLDYFLEALYCEPWAITQSRFEAVKKVVHSYLDTKAEIDLAKLGAELPPAFELVGKVAVVPVVGLILPKASGLEAACGAFSCQTFRNTLAELSALPEVETILLNVDSGGGMVRGGLETTEALKLTKKSKKVIAYSDGIIASQAYYIACQASRVYLSASAEAGSIGCFCAYLDQSQAFLNEGLKVDIFKGGNSKFKAMGTMGTSLTDEQKAYLQESVDTKFAEFVALVKANRRNATEDATSGKMFRAEEAINSGLADGIINNLDDLVTYLNR